MKLIRENLLLLTVSLGIFLAWFFPEPGVWLKEWGAVGPIIVLIFFCQGVGLEGKMLGKRAELLKILSWGFVVSQIMGPVLGYLFVHSLNWQSDKQVGFILICSMAPTLVSGTVIAGRAGGDGASAIVLAVGLNVLAIVAIPANLQWSLGAVVEVDEVGLFLKLLFLVLVPAVAGQFLGRWKPAVARRGGGLFRLVPIIALGTIVYLSCSSQAHRLKEVSSVQLGSLLAPSVLVHLALLGAGYAGARYPLGIQESACRSLAIVCSQKTLPIAIAIWSVTFAQLYPLAVLPALVFHPSQILLDGILATFWRAKSGFS